MDDHSALRRALTRKIMTEPSDSERHTKIHQEKTYHDIAITKDSAGPMAAGRTTYREEYQCNYGPDLDEPVDGTESGHEF
jgi:hypothetical protein